MNRRKPKRSPIVVETSSVDLDLLRRLERYEPNEYRRIIALVESYVAIHEREHEPEWEFAERLHRVRRRTQEAN